MADVVGDKAQTRSNTQAASFTGDKARNQKLAGKVNGVEMAQFRDNPG